MNVLETSLRFTTPAFLGGADQSAEWRTPPIKATLRHFWRMVQWTNSVHVVHELRRREHALFGSAGDDGDRHSGKSLLRLRLNRWDTGDLHDWGQLATRRINVGNNSVPAALYLGFGPLIYDKKQRGPAMGQPPAIQAGAEATLRMAVVPRDATRQSEAAEHMNALLQAMALMHHFGTLGSRSRNGWGSCMLDVQHLPALDERHLVAWQEALQTDWPHGVGQDARGALVWQTRKAFSTWEDAVIALAQLRADINRSGGERTLLSYPVTKKKHPGWREQDRLPSSLRFKVTQDGPGAYRARLAHFPCAPTQDMQTSGRVSMQDLVRTWECVHNYLDREDKLGRVEQLGALQ